MKIDIPYFAYGAQVLFQDFSLVLPENSCVGLLGASGIGKTTLLRLIAGLEGPLCKESPPFVAYLTQQGMLMPWMTVRDNLCLGFLLQKKIPPSSRIDHTLDMLGLWNHQDQYPHALSAGMRQRLTLGRTLLQDAPLILLDEPFSALDYPTRQTLFPFVRQIFKEKRVLFVTHDPHEAFSLCDQVYEMRGVPARLIRLLPDHKKEVVS